MPPMPFIPAAARKTASAAAAGSGNMVAATKLPDDSTKPVIPMSINGTEYRASASPLPFPRISFAMKRMPYTSIISDRGTIIDVATMAGPWSAAAAAHEAALPHSTSANITSCWMK